MVIRLRAQIAERRQELYIDERVRGDARLGRICCARGING
jgi:hypothetical protein